jgi:hypothetical protein
MHKLAVSDFFVLDGALLRRILALQRHVLSHDRANL